MREFDLELTRRCNLRCGYCYLGHEPSDATISRETIELALDFVARQSHLTPGESPGAKSPGAKSPGANSPATKPLRIKLNFYGGEPLLAYDELRQVVDGAKRRGLHLSYTAVTNGTIANQAMADYFRAHGVGVGRSIDGCPEALAVNRPDILPAYRRGTELYRDQQKTRRGTISPAAAKYLLKSVRFIHEDLGIVKGGTFMPDFYAAWTEQETAELLEQLWAVGEEYVRDFKAGRPFYFYWFDREKRRFELKDRKPCSFGCGGGQTLCAINCHGYVYVCHRFTTEPPDSPFCAGHLRELLASPLAARPAPLRFGPAWRDWQQFIAARRRHPQCGACIAQLGCTDGCCHTNYKFGGRLETPVPLYCTVKQECAKIVAWIDSQLRHVDSAWYKRPGGRRPPESAAGGRKQLTPGEHTGGNGRGKPAHGKSVPVSPRAGNAPSAACRRAAAVPLPAVRPDDPQPAAAAAHSRCLRCGGERRADAAPGPGGGACPLPGGGACPLPGERPAQADPAGGDPAAAGDLPAL